MQWVSIGTPVIFDHLLLLAILLLIPFARLSPAQTSCSLHPTHQPILLTSPANFSPVLFPAVKLTYIVCLQRK